MAEMTDLKQLPTVVRGNILSFLTPNSTRRCCDGNSPSTATKDGPNICIGEHALPKAVGSLMPGKGDRTEILTEEEINFLLSMEKPSSFSSSRVVVKDAVLGKEVAGAAEQATRTLLSKGKLRPARMGTSSDLWKDGNIRGDKIMWVNECLPGRETSSIFEVVRQIECKLRRDLGMQDTKSFPLSAQLSAYDAGSHGYVRHLDISSDRTNTHHRMVTAVYYMNTLWKDGDGGCLRVYCTPNDDVSSTLEPYPIVDVEPFSDRLVIFRSDKVEHEVLHNVKMRMALTMWFYNSISYGGGGGSNPPNGVKTKCKKKSSPPELPLPNPNDTSSLIFVSIASHRDPETVATVRSCLAEAAFPDRLRVRVLLQLQPGDPRDDDIFTSMNELVAEVPVSHVSVVLADARIAAGPVTTRVIARSLWAGEPYVLQIDSHMRFRPNWDSFLIGEIHACPSPKPILTTYPPGYSLPPSSPPSETRPTLLCPTTFGKDGFLRQKGRLLLTSANAPIPSPLWAAGFNFSRANAWLDVPYDPHLRHVFFGEEVSMAARLFTWGWDFFAPSESVLYHLWSRAGRYNFRNDTQYPNSEKEYESWFSAQRLKALLTPPHDEEVEMHHHFVEGDNEEEECVMRNDNKTTKFFGNFGLGQERSLLQFEEHVGIALRSRQLRQGAEWGGLDKARFLENDSSFSIDNDIAASLA